MFTIFYINLSICRTAIFFISTFIAHSSFRIRFIVYGSSTDLWAPHLRAQFPSKPENKSIRRNVIRGCAGFLVCLLSLKIYSFPSGAIYISNRISTSRYFQEKCEVFLKLFILICPRIFCVLHRIIAIISTKAFVGIIFHVQN